LSCAAAIGIGALAALAAPAPAFAADDDGAATGAAARTGDAEPSGEAEDESAHPAPSPKPKAFPKLKRASLSHDMQFGLALFSGTGYRGIFPYKENIFCGQIENMMASRVCSGRLPVFIDVQASFGIASHWDLLVDLRFGAEADFTATRQFAVAPGFRYWVEPEDTFKLFTTVQVAYDTTVENTPALKSYDIAVRNSNGLMFEVMRNLGFYVQFGETIGFVRWLRFEIDVGLGVQARFP
jgi:hypothetical protein